MSGACGSDPKPAPTMPVVIWKPVGAWSGRGNRQTETFTSDTGGFRLHWATTNESAPVAGTLKVADWTLGVDERINGQRRPTGTP